MKVVKVKGHATVGASGLVKRQDKDGHEAADGAADLGRRRQPEQKIMPGNEFKMLHDIRNAELCAMRLSVTSWPPLAEQCLCSNVLVAFVSSLVHG